MFGHKSGCLFSGNSRFLFQVTPRSLVLPSRTLGPSEGDTSCCFMILAYPNPLDVPSKKLQCQTRAGLFS